MRLAPESQREKSPHRGATGGQEHFAR